MSLFPRIRLSWAVAAALVLSVIVVAGCGGDGGGHDMGQMSPPSSANVRFLDEMAPHHQSAIEMGQIARTRAEHPEISRLAAAIITAQRVEIAEIAQIRRTLPNRLQHSASGGTGMHGSMRPADLARLRSAKPFDQAFIELMVPHHQDAIHMSRAVIETGSDAKTKALAKRIMAAQSAEIRQMRTWYQRWYGKALPVGAAWAGGNQHMSGG